MVHSVNKNFHGINVDTTSWCCNDVDAILHKVMCLLGYVELFVFLRFFWTCQRHKAFIYTSSGKTWVVFTAVVLLLVVRVLHSRMEILFCLSHITLKVWILQTPVESMTTIGVDTYINETKAMQQAVWWSVKAKWSTKLYFPPVLVIVYYCYRSSIRLWPWKLMCTDEDIAWVFTLYGVWHCFLEDECLSQIKSI